MRKLLKSLDDEINSGFFSEREPITLSSGEYYLWYTFNINMILRDSKIRDIYKL
jgi:hypothetical protein